MRRVRYVGGRFKSVVEVGALGVPIKLHGKGNCRALSISWDNGLRTAHMLEDFEFIKKGRT